MHACEHPSLLEKSDREHPCMSCVYALWQAPDTSVRAGRKSDNDRLWASPTHKQAASAFRLDDLDMVVCVFRQ